MPHCFNFNLNPWQMPPKTFLKYPQLITKPKQRLVSSFYCQGFAQPSYQKVFSWLNFKVAYFWEQTLKAFQQTYPKTHKYIPKYYKTIVILCSPSSSSKTEIFNDLFKAQFFLAVNPLNSQIVCQFMPLLPQLS